MNRYKLTIEYCGDLFCGWQYQQSALSVQEALQDSLNKLTGESVTIYAAGRTDSGVHARGQVAHIDLQKAISTQTLVNGLNFYLKSSAVSVLNAEAVGDTFHARFSAKQRTYKYFILNRCSPPAIDKQRVLWVKNKLNVDAMVAAAQVLVGTHDFSSFRSSKCQAVSAV